VAAVNEPAGDVPVMIRLGTAADADTAARLHADLISEGFLAHLGPRFLGHLYRCVAEGPDSFLLIADGTAASTAGSGLAPVAGFLAGALDLRALYRRFALRQGFVAALTSLPRLLTALPRVWETLRHGVGGHGVGGHGVGAEPSDGPSGAELLSVAVDPGWQGRHVGVLLVEGFVAEVERRGVDIAQVVVGADNAPAVALYGRAGFRQVRTFELHRGTSSLLMRRPG
jgi:ribosomal protein S18 acetylase RimI-like enzyme